MKRVGLKFLVCLVIAVLVMTVYSPVFGTANPSNKKVTKNEVEYDIPSFEIDEDANNLNVFINDRKISDEDTSDDDVSLKGSSSADYDSDGLSDKTETTEAEDKKLDKDDFNKTEFETNSVINLEFDRKSYENLFCSRAFIELEVVGSYNIKDLKVDVGDDGEIDWESIDSVNQNVKFGRMKTGLNQYFFENYLNEDDKEVSIPIKFVSSQDRRVRIKSAEILFEGVNTDPRRADTSGDGMLDGWKDVDGDLKYERKGEDGVLGTRDDEIPGALAYNFNPTEENYLGKKGRVDWGRYNKYIHDINQANGNLALQKVDMSIDALGFDISIKRTYNSFDHDKDSPLGKGWTMNYFEKIEPVNQNYVRYVDETGAEFKFESLGDGEFETPRGCSFDLIKDEDEYKLRYKTGKVKTFDEAGKLVEIEDKNGNSLHFKYKKGRLRKIKDDSGLSMKLKYKKGHLVKVKDPIGRKVRYRYENDRLVEYTDPAGNEYHYLYNKRGLLSTTINPVGLFNHYDYSYSHFPRVKRVYEGEYKYGTYTDYHVDFEADHTYPSHITWKDGEGYETKNTFGKGGVMIKHKNPDGTISHLGYDLDYNVVKAIDKKGHVWRDHYGPMNEHLKSVDSTGNISKTEYRRVEDPDEYICVKTSQTDKRDYSSNREYDGEYNLKEYEKKDGKRYRYVKNDKGQLVKKIAPNGAVTEYEYDEHGNRVKVIDALGHVTEYEYDKIGRKTREIKPNGAVTRYKYDKLSRVTKEIDDQGNKVIKNYDAVGNLVKKIDKRGGVTRYEYDVFGNMISKTDALGNTVHYSYDNNDNKVRKINARGYPTYYEYDCMDRLVKKTDAHGNSERYRYDEFHNRVETIDKNGNSWKKKYDKMGRVVEEICPYDEAIRYEYNAEGQVVKKIDRMGYVTEYEYDKVGRVVRMKRKLGPEGTNVTFRYDEVGNLVSVIQADGDDISKWNYEYDLLGRKVKETSPLGNEETYDYDKMGNLVEYTNAEDESTNYDYDSLRRLTSVSFPDGKHVDITHDLKKNLRVEEYKYPKSSEEAKAPHVKKIIENYNKLCRTEKKTRVWSSGEERSISYDYDSAGNMIRMNDQFDRTTRYYYDALNRVNMVMDYDHDITTYEYDAIGQLKKTVYPTGATIYRDYNKANKLTELQNVRSDGTIISSFEYSYNWNGNIVSMTDKFGNTTEYDYDKEDRLTSVKYPSELEINYKYDKKDNLVQKTHLKEGEVVNEVNNEYDIGNRLIRSNDKKFSYDDDGNQIQAGDTSFDYMTSHVNGNNVKRLKSVHEHEEDDELVASYSYTLEGLRTGKYLNSGESEISYHYSGKNVQYEKWDDGRTVRYTHPSTGSSSCSSCGGCGNEKNVFTDHPISIEINGSKYYYLYNGQGSVTELVNADEEVVNQYRYTPFGSPRLKAESVYNPYQYTGRILDEETGQYYYRARMYSAAQSRFTTQDPAGMQEGPNMYAYVGNNPTNKRDPTGLNPGDAIIDGGGVGYPKSWTYVHCVCHNYYCACTSDNPPWTTVDSECRTYCKKCLMHPGCTECDQWEQWYIEHNYSMKCYPESYDVEPYLIKLPHQNTC